MRISGAKIVMECLLEQGVRTVFGYPGASVIDIYDELYKYRRKIEHILMSHEQHAAHAADGYARTTGRTGVCIATSGPGATNLITGIAAAFMDSSPVVFITGNVTIPLIGRDSFQEVDITSISMPVTKNNYMVKDVNKLAETFREAFLLAACGRPGPVLIDIPKNILVEKTELAPPGADILPDAYYNRLYNDLCIEDIDVLIDMITTASCPLILAGGGVIRSGASTELAAFAESIDAPVVLTMMGLGAVSSDARRFIGLVGMHGANASNVAVNECDLLIAVGTRFSDRVTIDVNSFAKNAKIVHIDIDRAEINKNIRADHHITGDAKTALAAVISKISAQGVSFDHSGWMERVQLLKEQAPPLREGNPRNQGSGRYSEFRNSDITPKAVIETIHNLTGGNAIIVTDVGQHQLWTAQYYRFNKPNTFVTSGGYGAMGFGVGAAIGACFGVRDSNRDNMQVILITGDGSFRMNSMELAVIKQYKLPIITIVFNNRVLGMVRQWQSLFYERRYSATNLDRGPDFVKLASAYSIDGVCVRSLPEFKSTLSKMLANKKPGLIELPIPKDTMVNPMVSANAQFS